VAIFAIAVPLCYIHHDYGHSPFNQNFQCEFPEISWGKWNIIFWLTAPEWKMLSCTFVCLEVFNDFDVKISKIEANRPLVCWQRDLYKPLQQRKCRKKSSFQTFRNFWLNAKHPMFMTWQFLYGYKIRWICALCIFTIPDKSSVPSQSGKRHHYSSNLSSTSLPWSAPCSAGSDKLWLIV